MNQRFPLAALTGWASELVGALGAPAHVAEVVARHLVTADASGHASHGLAMIPTYLDAIRSGDLVPAAEPRLVADQQARIVVDGGRGFGHYTMDWTMREVSRRAESAGVCLASIIHCGHSGRLGGYALDAAEQGKAVLIGAGTVADEIDALVAPAGSREPLLGTNPLAFGHPGRPPVVLDMSTSAMAYYQLCQLAAAGARVPHGVLVDVDGVSTTQAADIERGAVLLPFGGYKGYGLSVMVGLLSGLASAPTEPAGGAFVIAIDKRDGGGAGAAATDRLRAATPSGPDPVTVPGDRSRAVFATSIAEGVEVPGELVAELCDRIGLPAPATTA